jgi:very-short-patch-repair endonuclease
MANSCCHRSLIQSSGASGAPKARSLQIHDRGDWRKREEHAWPVPSPCSLPPCGGGLGRGVAAVPHAPVDGRQRRLAKHFRRTMTRAETLLWRYLKAHHLDGLGFRRQVPMGRFIADFSCHSARVIVEVDGESHDFESRQRHDENRDAWFASQGYVVLRFSNEEVLTSLEGVLEVIRQTATPRLPVPPSLTFPHKGGGNRPAQPRRPCT